MTKTLSLPVCRKLSEMGIEIDSYFYWIESAMTSHLRAIGQNPQRPKLIDKYSAKRVLSANKYLYRAYQLDELPALLRAIGEKNNWNTVCEKCGGARENECVCNRTILIDEWQYHFLRICDLYAIDSSLGEGSEAERYVLELLK